MKIEKRFLWQAAGVLSMIAAIEILHFVYGGRIWAYLRGHFWLAGFLPLVLIFLALLARNLYLEYRQDPEVNSEPQQAGSAKP
jgi:hypothetical protein